MTSIRLRLPSLCRVFYDSTLDVIRRSVSMELITPYLTRVMPLGHHSCVSEAHPFQS
jgi:hypothetical protein